MLALLNLLNTVFDYLMDFRTTEGLGRMPGDRSKELVVEFAKLIALQVFQLDGLKQVLPESC